MSDFFSSSEWRDLEGSSTFPKSISFSWCMTFTVGEKSLSRSSLCNMYDTRDTSHHIQLTEALKMRNVWCKRGSWTVCTLSGCNQARRHWHELCLCFSLKFILVVFKALVMDSQMFNYSRSIQVCGCVHLYTALKWLEIFRGLKATIDPRNCSFFLQLCSVPVTSILTESFGGHEGCVSPPWEAVIPWSLP